MAGDATELAKPVIGTRVPAYGCIQFAVWDYFIYLFVLWGDDYISWNDNADGNFCLNIMAEESV